MSWKPKTIAGKIVKGTVIGAGSVLGLAAGVGAVGGVVKGVGVVQGGKTGLVAVKNVIDKVGAAATNLVTGTTKAERDIIKDFRNRTAEDQRKLAMYNKYIKAGATEAEAKAAAGLTMEELQTDDKRAVVATSTGTKKLIMYGAIGFIALMILPKILKR